MAEIEFLFLEGAQNGSGDVKVSGPPRMRLVSGFSPDASIILQPNHPRYFKFLTRSAGDHALDPLVDDSRADTLPSINWPTANSQLEIPELQTSGIELEISGGSYAVSPWNTPSSPEEVENSTCPELQEEKPLEKHEKLTEKQQARDLKTKTKVRMIKMLLRGVNFTCSLIVLAMTSTALHIFFATRHLPAENNLPAWATGTQTWPQYVVLATSCVSLAFCLLIFYSYWRGGHHRAEKTAVYYTIFAIGFFIFSLVMWGIAAGILQGSKNNSGNKDIWGWSCVDNKRRQLFSEKVDYALVCKLQSWSLICCIIEVFIETITISIYAVIFYRYHSKRRLRKSMDARNRARSDLYLSELRSQSAPNTPGFGLLSRSYSSYTKSPRLPLTAHTTFPQESFAHGAQPTYPVEDRIEHAPVAPGEQTYQPVPIPGAYVDPANSGTAQHISSSGLHRQAASRH